VYNMNRLALLAELHRRGTLHEVSRSLSFSPSTVSQQLKVLEREVGVPLVERAGRGLRLTREGELLAGHAVALMQQMELAEADVAAARGEARGTLRMATFQTAALAVLPRTLDLLAADAPELRVVVAHIDAARMLDALAAREFDLVLGEEYPGRPASRRDDVDVVPLLEDPMVLVVPLSAGEDPTRSLPWVMEPAGNDGREWAVSAARSLGIEPEVQYESPDLLVQMRLVETGHAVAILPGLLLDSEKPGVRRIELPGSPHRRVFAAVRHGSQRSPAIGAVLGAFRQTVRAEG
jgi:DNA-binding transcriptional LysR family regulator